MEDTGAEEETPTAPQDDLSGVATAAKALADAVRAEVGKAVRGQEDVIETALIALLAGGHALFEGVPGTAKTLLVRTLAAACQAQFKRIQFTPDLMPSDIVGTNIFEASSGEFRLRQGPVFTEFLLADEINRTPPKTQAALLEAMEERRVSIDGESLPLPPIFTVFATQNPVEFEGTYPLPEAQVDRFLVKVLIDYPDEAAENEMLGAWDAGFQARDLATADVKPVASVADILAIRASLPRVKIEEKTRAYIIQLVRATRQHKQLLLGASPRASVALLLASKTRALLQGRDYVNPDDIKAMSLPVLRHRVLLRPEAELEGIGPDRILSTLVASVEVPR
jgi:MoxR-like ATPase